MKRGGRDARDLVLVEEAEEEEAAVEAVTMMGVLLRRLEETSSPLSPQTPRAQDSMEARLPQGWTSWVQAANGSSSEQTEGE